MKIAHHLGQSKVVIEEVSRPIPKAGEVLVKNVVSALCGSEMHDYRKDGIPGGNNGHEAAGVVAELGEGVTSLKVGQRVGVSAISGCGKCDYCKKGQYTWCDNFSFYGNMHAEYFVISAHACHIIPDDIPWEVGVLITGDGLGVPYHTSRKIASPEVETVAVFGLGPIGLGNVLVQSHLGRRVIGIDLSPDRRALATDMGASDVIAADQVKDMRAAVVELTGGKGADVCIEAAGIPVTAHQCFACARKGGIVVFNGEQPKLELSPSEDFIRRDITAIGSWFYHFCEYPAMREAYESGLRVDKLVTHQFPLDQVSEAYQAMANGKSGKVLLHYGK